ncbi:MAG: enoyl-CoA hydratase/isomerase family protein [Candidatus Hydrogenedentes bacterium]|nr:enoyl-CoA hydratase/isomerase family protein [Candidatus Hydrogenedentota bacterium]
MSDAVRFERQGNVGIVTVDSPPVNAMGHAVRVGLVQGIVTAIADPEVEVIVLICAGRTFIAGADIKEFSRPMEEPFHDAVIQRIEDSPKPVIAAIHGTALGGGMETALGCHYRVAVPSAKCGLPEVNLGLIPGAGGTQRLPRLIGAEAAVRMIASGEPVTAAQGQKLGLIDAIVEGDLLEGAIAFARAVLADGRGVRRSSDSAVAGASEALFQAARQEVASKKRGFEAPQRAIDAVEAAANHTFAEGMAMEKDIFMACATSPQARALQHVFFAERQAPKVKGLPDDTAERNVASVAVIGAGTMGGGIAMACLNAGIPVVLIESEQAALDRGVGIIEKTYASSVKKGRLKQDKMDAAMAALTPALDLAAVADVDLVIEAVFEDMDLKKQIFERLDAICKPGAILGTNTSTLDINEIAASTSRPEDVIGLHFFSPAHLMKLLEIVRAEKSSDEVLASSLAFARRIRKIATVVGVCDGFVGNRMVDPYLREASFLLEEGALPQQVDRVLQDFGMAMGPFAMSDLAGLDVLWRIRQRRDATRPKDIRHSQLHDRICELGRYGQKTGAGIYRYEPGGRAPLPDPEITALIEAESARLGLERRPVSEDEIVERCVYALVNEGARILEEGIAQRPSDIDIIYVYGYGFPAFRGGPMFYADQVGLQTVYERIRAYEDRHGPLWKPAPLLTQLARENRHFRDLR